ncbi:SpoIIE family protein phosphatase [Tuwongella immobilis]|uniref:FHA domain-containing protein n=1 Tax=Tuwongella immobilis TaxID=692036 RepID=A0A6C2YNU1_9BACT|nr:SpoIIE family protein phosphatase [Tuwongella immobilis]VIP03037.1 protein serine phosphatase with gaf sensor : Protein serine phosphatase with GAF(S) sensor(S) OS=Pirellula staleyi (strain ATCC 27377 / DSM 6068 / ICPB 4128) GN=Psta_4013 PE=4 SV=1: FHA: GAF_3: SpoIIE [Tuwongella immobilis]VTS03199.1 protein serine phosphatase with gaf sensor : Protein serine phosphatase with GAF(S) sensor(S) OS=Pirellula staleyi (strain ATCC 27377 / DSM 6068 / ICPB 4128) GN=Psta_4013 PE=4 SV=1: FHA: GAF_3: Spo
MPKLIVIKSPNGAATGMSFDLLPGQPEVTLGRIEECQIVIPDGSVSRKHALVSYVNGNHFITDLRSRNGTFVNNSKIDPDSRIALKHEDKIRICDFLFRYDDENATRRPTKKDLPEHLKKDSTVPSPDDDPNTSSTIEATIGRQSPQQLLDAQPAERLRVLIEITAQLNKTLQLDELLPRIADTLFNVFKQADRCFVILTDETANQLIPKVIKTRRPTPGQGGDRFSKTIVRNCLDKLQSYLTEDASNDSNLSPSASIAEFRIRSVMCVPLATPEGKPLGVIQLDSQDRAKKFTQDDVRFLNAVAMQASVALENARLHESRMALESERNEKELARKLQLGFLPRAAPILSNYEFFFYYGAAKTVGGDYFDFVPLADGKIAIMLGDVSGKGVPAALLMAKLSAEARYSVLAKPTISEAIATLNEQLMLADLHDRYVTFVAAVLDPQTNEVTMVNAGHEAPLIYRGANQTLEPILPEEIAGCPLCWLPNNEYQSYQFTLQPYDSIVLFTDGVIDAINAAGVQFTREGIYRVVVSDDVIGAERLTPKTIGERVISAVQKHAAGVSQFDDIAFVSFGRLPVADTGILPTQRMRTTFDAT